MASQDAGPSLIKALSESDALLASRAIAQYGVSSSLSMKSVQSPDIAAHRGRQVHSMADRGRHAKDFDKHWERTYAGWDAHKQQMEAHHKRLISARQQDVARRTQKKLDQESEREMIERQAILRALKQQQETEGERASAAANDSAEQRRRRHLEHQDYPARLRREQKEREQAALRAIAAKDELARLAKERADEARRQKASCSPPPLHLRWNPALLNRSVAGYHPSVGAPRVALGRAPCSPLDSPRSPCQGGQSDRAEDGGREATTAV